MGDGNSRFTTVPLQSMINNEEDNNVRLGSKLFVKFSFCKIAQVIFVEKSKIIYIEQTMLSRIPF